MRCFAGKGAVFWMPACAGLTTLRNWLELTDELSLNSKRGIFYDTGI